MQPWLVAIVLFSIVTIISQVQQAEAAPNFVSITLSDACDRSKDCPKVDDLIKYDTSNQKMSGKFFDGLRGKPQIKNHYLFYKYDTVFVEPDYGTLVRSKQIIIEPPIHMWYKMNRDQKVINNTIIDYHNRFIDSCSIARISWDESILQDTINYLQSGCKAEKKYEEKQVIKRIDTKHNYKESQKYKLEQYQKWVKDNCLKKRNACQNLEFDFVKMERDAPLKR